MTSFQKRVRELAPELQMAGIAAIALALSLFLPWYQKSFARPAATSSART